MATIDATKHAITHVAAGDAQARLNSMKADGPLQVAAGNFIAVKLGRKPSLPGGMVKIGGREIEFITGPAFEIEGVVRDGNIIWSLDPDRCGQLLADADAAGLLDWDKKSDSIEKLAEEFKESCAGLPAAPTLGTAPALGNHERR